MTAPLLLIQLAVAPDWLCSDAMRAETPLEARWVVNRRGGALTAPLRLFQLAVAPDWLGPHRRGGHGTVVR